MAIEQMSKYSKIIDRFISSSAFYTYTYKGGYNNHDEMVDRLIDYLKEKAGIDIVKNFYKRFKKTTNSLIFNALLYVLNSDVEKYKAECLEILLDKSALEGFGSCISYLLEEMLKRSWPILDDTERKGILKAIRTVSPKYNLL